MNNVNVKSINMAAMAIMILLGISSVTHSATMYSTKDSYMGAGTFYGPGTLDDEPIFDVIIRNIGFSGTLSYITPFVNNGKDEPNICAEHESEGVPDGLLSDNATEINENVDVCSMDFKGMKVMMGIVEGGPHHGQQIATTAEDGTMIMTMDFAMDLQIGEGGIIKVPFYGTTGEVTVPSSLQTQLGIKGGLDQAGSLKVGEKLRGRLGDFNSDGMLDGAIVVAGNMPLSSVFLPGAPYALIRYFDTDIPYDGAVFGKLPNQKASNKEADKPIITVVEPTP